MGLFHKTLTNALEKLRAGDIKSAREIINRHDLDLSLKHELPYLEESIRGYYRRVHHALEEIDANNAQSAIDDIERAKEVHLANIKKYLIKLIRESHIKLE